MKLVKSKTEEKYRKTLICTQEKIFNDSSLCRLLEVIKANNETIIESAYIISHTPEQGEDIYRVLINGSLINLIELDRLDDDVEPIFEAMSINEYKKGLARQSRIKLAIALDLACE